MSAASMRSAWLVGPGRFEIRDVPRPDPGRGELRVAVVTCGICASDTGMWQRTDAIRTVPPFREAIRVMNWSVREPSPVTYPWKFGHEMAGIVEAVGHGVRDLREGDLVTGLAYAAFADACIVPATRLVPLPRTMDDRSALGEPVACAVNAERRAKVTRGDAVVLIGSGFMNLLMLQLVRLRRPRLVVVIDVRQDALTAARQLGADVAIDGTTGDVHARLSEALGPQGANVVIEGTGRSEGLALAGQAAAIRGRIVIVSFHRARSQPVDLELWAIKGLDIVNAHERDPRAYMRGMRIGVRLMDEGALRVAPLITHRYPLPAIAEAFDTAMHKPSGFLKATIEPRVAAA